MIIDKEGKLFGKISVIDVIVILAILVAGFGMYLRFTSGAVKDVTVKDKPEKKVEYVIKIKGIREGNVAALKRKGEIYELSTGEKLGKITNIEVSESVDYRDMATGEIVKMNTPEKFDVLITVEYEAHAGDDGFYTPYGTILSAGSRYDFFTKYSRIGGEIKSIKEI